MILQEMYTGYVEVCEMLSIITITERRHNQLLGFAKKYIWHPTNKRFSPRN